MLPLVVRLPELWESAEFPIVVPLVHSGTTLVVPLPWTKGGWATWGP